MATEIREFQSAVSTPEDVAANKAYFEAQGVEYETTAEEATSTETPAEDTTEALQPKAEPAKAEVEQQVDAETEAEWKAAENDGKRKHSFGQLRAERRKAYEAEAAANAKVKELEARIAELAKPAEPKAEAFAEAEPKEPIPADYDNADDPRAALAKAQVDFTKQWNRWDRKREAHEAKEAAKAVEPEKPAPPTIDPQLVETVNTRLAAAKAAMPDFDEKVANNPGLNDAIRAAAISLPDGLALLHRMVTTNPEQFSKLQQATIQTRVVNGVTMPTNEANNMAMFMLGQFASVPVVIPPQPQPKEVSPVPSAVRGRTVATIRRQDLSGDERREQLAREMASGLVS